MLNGFVSRHDENVVPNGDNVALSDLKKNVAPEKLIAVQVKVIIISSMILFYRFFLWFQKNAYKRYGKGPSILDNFNMTVPRGTIYGLLGSR